VSQLELDQDRSLRAVYCPDEEGQSWPYRHDELRHLRDQILAVVPDSLVTDRSLCLSLRLLIDVKHVRHA
jgi:hypothetical protein